jgi:hypothetical protein
MIESRIICCEPVDLKDLSLNLRRGQEVWISNDLANRSRDLQRALAMGKVRVTRMERHVANKPPPPPKVLPPFVTRSRPLTKNEYIRDAISDPDAVLSQEQNHQVLEERLRESEERLRENLRETIAEEIAKALAAHAELKTPPQGVNSGPSVSAAVDASMIATVMEEVLKKNLPNATSGGVIIPSSRPRTPTSASDEPLYMPSNLVDKNAKSKISVSSNTSGKTEDVDDATAALRALKKNKNRSGTNGNEEK